MSILFAATLRTKKGTVRVDHGGNLTLPRSTPIKKGGVTDIALEDGEAVSKRVTLTRVAALGVLALAAKKTRGGERILVIETADGDVHTYEVERKRVNDAVEFVAKARSLAL